MSFLVAAPSYVSGQRGTVLFPSQGGSRRIASAFGIPCGILVALLLAHYCIAAEPGTEVKLAEFRALVQSASQPEKAEKKGQAEKSTKPEPNPERAEDVFFRLLMEQGRVAAARQSLDRLSGWEKTAQVRLQTQNASAEDVDLLRFAAARAAAVVAQSEAARLKVLREANALLKRPPESPLTAMTESFVAESAATPPATAAPTAASSKQEVGADVASRKAQFEKELLPLGNELLSKMYQSYLFGGTPVAALLWQEQQVYQAELAYRSLLVEMTRQQASAGD